MSEDPFAAALPAYQAEVTHRAPWAWNRMAKAGLSLDAGMSEQLKAEVRYALPVIASDVWRAAPGAQYVGALAISPMKIAYLLLPDDEQSYLVEEIDLWSTRGTYVSPGPGTVEITVWYPVDPMAFQVVADPRLVRPLATELSQMWDLVWGLRRPAGEGT